MPTAITPAPVLSETPTITSAEDVQVTNFTALQAARAFFTTLDVTNAFLATPVFSGTVEIADDALFTLGSDNDQVLLNRSSALAANTAVTSAILGTPVTPALAANSLILSNVTASGDIMLAANLAGNSQAWLWVDSSASLAQLLGAGVAVLEWTATALEVKDNILFTLGDDADQVFLNRTAVLNANTALTGAILGTPVTPAIAANSLIISNATASGDILLAANLAGNSQAWLWVDSSASLAQLLGAGVPVLEWSATALEVKDDILFTLGTDGDEAIVHRTAVLNANTALTGAIVGTPVTPALAANSLIISNVTADGDILIASQTGGHTHAAMWVDSSAALTLLYAGAGVEVLRLASAAVSVTGTLSASGTLRGGARVIETITQTDIATAGNATYSAANIATGVINRDCAGGNRSDTTDTAANIIAGTPALSADGNTIDCVVVNTSDAAETITIVGGTGVSVFAGTAATFSSGGTATTTIAQNKSAILRFRRTSGSAVTCYIIGG